MFLRKEEPNFAPVVLSGNIHCYTPYFETSLLRSDDSSLTVIFRDLLLTLQFSFLEDIAHSDTQFSLAHSPYMFYVFIKIRLVQTPHQRKAIQN